MNNLPACNASQYVSRSIDIGLTNAISLVSICVFVLDIIRIPLYGGYWDLRQMVLEYGRHTKRADCSDRTGCCVSLSGFVGDSKGPTPPGKRSLSLSNPHALFHSSSHHAHVFLFNIPTAFFTLLTANLLAGYNSRIKGKWIIFTWGQISIIKVHSVHLVSRSRLIIDIMNKNVTVHACITHSYCKEVF